MSVLAKADRKVVTGAALSAASAAASLVSREEVRSRSRMLAYRAVASKVGRSATWVRNLVAGTVRTINADLAQRIDALLIRELELEIQRLTHELEIARQRGAHPCSIMVSQVESHLAHARKVMEQMK